MARLRLIEDSGSDSSDAALTSIASSLEKALQGGERGAVEALDLLLRDAAEQGASDVHLEPWEDCLALRYRIDGMLHHVASIPKEHQGRILTRLKVLARIVVYQKETPQDGRIEPEATPAGKAMRVATVPTVYGEKAVVRMLDLCEDLFRLDALGFDDALVAGLREVIRRPQGTLLLTGPSSSGKTTTIYALLRELRETAEGAPHIVTIEDPVEYRLGQIAQSEINNALGFTYEAALRAMLRQDPEVIMLGEIRDAHTARIAIQAGLTGHLVISTIHSGTAAGVFTRLLDMGIEPFLIASSVSGVLAQRLVRNNCPECAAPYEPEPLLRNRFGVNDKNTLRRGQGCPACKGIGYRGRSAIGEFLSMDSALAEGVMAHSQTADLHKLALQASMVPLERAGMNRVLKNETTLEELARVLPPDREISHEA